jgi:hypothetical protein
MSVITLRSSFSKNSGLVISPQELRRNYLYGITMNSPFANKINLNFSDDDIEFHIRAAQREIENYLALKLKRQIVTETLQFDNDNWRHWGYIPTTFQVVYPLRLEGFLNTTKTATYPMEWLSSKQDSTDGLYFRQIYMVASGNTGAVTNSVIFAGLLPNLGYMNAGKIPNYWTPSYVTGFADNKVPYDILQSVGEMATISLLLIAGANIFGFPGLQSTSLSIDGLSQSLSSNLNAFGQRITQMNEALQKRLANQRDQYRGFSWSAV